MEPTRSTIRLLDGRSRYHHFLAPEFLLFSYIGLSPDSAHMAASPDGRRYTDECLHWSSISDPKRGESILRTAASDLTKAWNREAGKADGIECSAAACERHNL